MTVLDYNITRSSISGPPGSEIVPISPAMPRSCALLFTVMLTIARRIPRCNRCCPRSAGRCRSRQRGRGGFSARRCCGCWRRRSGRSGRTGRAARDDPARARRVRRLADAVRRCSSPPGSTAGSAGRGVRALHRRAADLWHLGAAAPPAVQAIVAGETTRDERTKALTLLGSAFGLGTILGPAIAPYLLLGQHRRGDDRAGRAGVRVCAVRARRCCVTVRRMLPDDRGEPRRGTRHAWRGRAPIPRSAGADRRKRHRRDRVAQRAGRLYRPAHPRLDDRRAGDRAMRQAMTGQAIGFLVIDRLHLAPDRGAASRPGIVLMMGAGAALLVQWGRDPAAQPRRRARWC